MEDNRYGYESQDSVQVDMTGPASGNEYEELNTETASGNEYKDQNTAEAQGNENETRNAAADERRSSASYQNAGSSYQSAYQSAYQGDYRSGAGNQSDYRNGAGYEKDAFSTEKKHKKSGRTGKAILAVLLAAVFGICAGAGAYGVSRAIGANTNGTSKAQAQLQIAEEPEEKEAREEVQQAPEEDASAVQSAREEASGTQEAAAAQGSEDAQASENSGDKDAAKARLQSRSEDVQLNTGEKYVVVTDVTEMVEKTMPSIVSVYNNYTLQYHD